MSKLSEYEELTTLGKGAFGEAFKCVHKPDKNLVNSLCFV